jgi:hypothetical protein
MLGGERDAQRIVEQLGALERGPGRFELAQRAPRISPQIAAIRPRTALRGGAEAG